MDADYIQFLQEVLPSMGLQWSGFRRVKGQVIKRLKRRIRDLALSSLNAYRAHLMLCPEEWEHLRGLCFVSVSRWYRDQHVFDQLRDRILPDLIQACIDKGDTHFRVWSAGCASGEEPYTIKLLWDFALAPLAPELQIDLIASDQQEHLLARANAAIYPYSNLKELPTQWRKEAFTPLQDTPKKLMKLKDIHKSGITWRREDLTSSWPEGPFHLVLCRNLAWTYFAPSEQNIVLDAISERLIHGGILLAGKGETLPLTNEYNEVPTVDHCWRRNS